jgi:hypothetical protein
VRRDFGLFSSADLTTFQWHLRVRTASLLLGHLLAHPARHERRERDSRREADGRGRLVDGVGQGKDAHLLAGAGDGDANLWDTGKQSEIRLTGKGAQRSAPFRAPTRRPPPRR